MPLLEEVSYRSLHDEFQRIAVQNGNYRLQTSKIGITLNSLDVENSIGNRTLANTLINLILKVYIFILFSLKIMFYPIDVQ